MRRLPGLAMILLGILTVSAAGNVADGQATYPLWAQVAQGFALGLLVTALGYGWLRR